ncbi:hypothetical protein PVL29_011302 [Vitis rotundifolia]|uniref:non-specific serine/threonine protein kinase n=1 Tax=Vitis rotundifolia TaxID=103349 RepID=A0AA38ZNE1_VITRO|nr:hypothetical protein PVL29_011302 [Vitis rotundifolia]
MDSKYCVGFISIDCGIAEGSDYKDKTTGLLYTSDAKFIDTGINGKISSKFMFATLIPQLTNVRSFPEGAKNCYTLSPKHGKNNNYLIRAFFMYGNYDSKDQPPEFKLHLGVEEWGTVKFTHSDKIVRREIIHVPKTDDIYVCLANTGSGTPFISALELRPLDNSTYTTESGSLKLFTRVDVGSKTSETVRYIDDVFDRIWDPVSWDYWAPINSSYVSGTLSNNEYKPPSNVMSTAVVPGLDSLSLAFYWDTDDPSQQFYVYMYFAEVEELEPGELREFNISLNGGSWRGPIVPGKMTPTTIWNTDSMSAPGRLNFSISKTDNSTRPPILNALEIYSVKQFLQSPTGQNEVDAIKKIKSVYKVMKSSWQGDPCIPRDYLWDGLICSDNGNDAPSIISLNLSSSNLTGRIDDSFSYLTSLQYLDLSYNNLTGEVPTFLAELPALKTLNLSWNNFTGSVPLALIKKVDDGTLSLSLDGNPHLCKTSSCKGKNPIVPIVSSAVFVLVLLGVFAIFWINKRKQRQEEKIMRQTNRHVSYSEIVSITGNFQTVIGNGASGKVYSGHLSDGTQVAVKMLSSASTHGSKECWTEAELLTRVHHRNLVSLLGYCDEDPNMGLMYEYMANGNLQEYLSGNVKDASVLTWEQRLRIAIDAAQALEYLHNGCKPPIIHRDVKTANILLDEKLQAKVADFGLSRCLPLENGNYLSGSYFSTGIAGTPGYLDPEYYTTSSLNEKSDVYSFGIVLLELITGRPPIIKQGEESMLHIVQWVSPIIARGEIRDIVDQRLQGDFDISSAWKAIDIAMACVTYSSTTRPTMSHVLLELKGCLNIEIAPERTWSMKEDNEKQANDSLEMIFVGTEIPKEIQKEMIKPNEMLEAKKQCLSYSEVKRITNNFREVIGHGGSGLVYSGHLSHGIKVAVKKLSPTSYQSFEQFRNEAQLLSTIHHRNLVSLMGYCDEGSNMLLIYEYMANGNLKEHLSGEIGSVLSWEQRLQTAIEAAQALEYLHEGCNPTIIHRDVKAANILLNEKMQAKVADFGWSRSMPSENPSHVSTTFVVGTSGYLDPQYNRTGQLTKESDVYSFGIVLLELISGRPAIMEDNRSILDWIRPIIERGEIEDIVDPRLQGIFNTNSAWRAIETAMCCVPFSSIERKTMSYVVSELKECLKLVEMSSSSNPGISITQPIGPATGPRASLDGNPYLCNTTSCAKAKKKNKKTVIVPVVVSITLFLILLRGLAILWSFKRRREQNKTLESKYLRLSYSEVERITDNFQHEIGKGGSGKVYRGCLSDGTEVAAQLLTRVHHRNLVSLFGYCDEGSSMVLVYEYMKRGNLKKKLADKEEAVLSWKQRVGIALDAAEDIKTDNILLNEKLEAKVADFGWSRSMPVEGQTHVSTRIVGTEGYFDPEYQETSRLTEKSDVYSFGIVLLELISGQPAIIKSSESSTIHIVQWVRPLLEMGDIGGIVDPRLNEDFDTNSAWKAVETAIGCVVHSSSERLTISDVVAKLKECRSYMETTTANMEEDSGSIITEAAMSPQAR